jgi:hypothetical protein
MWPDSASAWARATMLPLSSASSSARSTNVLASS